MTGATAATSPSMDELIGRITDEFLDALDRGERPRVEDYVDRYPDVAPVICQVFPALEIMRRLPSEPASDGERAAPDPQTGCLGDFRIVREIGRGGMGIVYEAEQISLARRVALKVLPFAAVLDPRQSQRFRTEAQAAAHLHHTNIVPVFFVGCERGVHYYAMQLIEGQPLTQLILGLRRLAGLEPADGTETVLTSALSPDLSAKGPAFFRAVARLGIQAAEALEHAHRQGVVHRDIKPGNLLIDGRGHLWVTDFGLAQVQSETTLTRTGDLVGTLRYMSPEQALARPTAVDHRTDIYSLGVTLYELLTLEQPFRSKDRQELLRQIAVEEPRPPRRMVRAIPAELETIILKAMGKDAAERYPSAQELADDLRRFLEDRPIRARRPTPAQWLKKWARRHRHAVWSACVSLVLLLLATVVGLTVSNVLISRERDRKVSALREREAALAIAKANERAARANLKLARKAVDGLYTQFADEMLELPRVLPLNRKLLLRRKFLLQGLEYYKEIATQGGADPQIRFETGRAYRLAAGIQQVLGQRTEAEQALRQAIDLLGRLVQSAPDQTRYRTELASSYSALGYVLVELGRFRDGVDAHRQAASLGEHLVAAYPAVMDYRVQLADTYMSLGVNPGLGVREAEHVLRESIRLYRELAAAFPDEPRYRCNLASGHYSLGSALAGSGRQQEAEASYREALTLDGPGDETPDWCRRRAIIADAYRGLGRALAATGRAEDAEGAFRRSIALCEKLSDDDPDSAEHWADQAAAQGGLADLQEKAHRLPEAAEAYRRTLRCFARLVAQSPDEPSYQVPQIGLLCDLGRVLAADGQPAEAKKARKQASELYERLVPRIMGDRDIPRPLLADFSFQGTRVLIALGRPQEAAEAAERAVGLYEALRADLPDTLAGRWRLAASSHLLGRARIATGRHGEAIEAYRKAVALRPDRALFNNDLAWMLVTAPDQRLHNPREAVRLARKATELDPPAANVWNTLGVARYRSGEFQAAIEALEKSEELGRGREFGFNALFLAMARWQLGERDEARRWYDRAVRWMDEKKRNDEELRRFHHEAATLLGLPERAVPPKAEEPRTPKG